MEPWDEDKRDEFAEGTPDKGAPEPKKKRKFGLSGSDAVDGDSLIPFSAKSLQLRPTSSSSSVPSTSVPRYERAVGETNYSVRNRFKNNNVQEEKVHRFHASFILPFFFTVPTAK
jgi:hypothetical protein